MRKQPLRRDEVPTWKSENFPFGEATIERPDSKKGWRKGTTDGTKLFYL